MPTYPIIAGPVTYNGPAKSTPVLEKGGALVILNLGNGGSTGKIMVRPPFKLLTEDTLLDYTLD